MENYYFLIQLNFDSAYSNIHHDLIAKNVRIGALGKIDRLNKRKTLGIDFNASLLSAESAMSDEDSFILPTQTSGNG